MIYYEDIGEWEGGRLVAAHRRFPAHPSPHVGNRDWNAAEAWYNRYRAWDARLNVWTYCDTRDAADAFLRAHYPARPAPAVSIRKTEMGYWPAIQSGIMSEYMDKPYTKETLMPKPLNYRIQRKDGSFCSEHDSALKAGDEATRLARGNPGVLYFVVEMLGTAMFEAPKPPPLVGGMVWR